LLREVFSESRIAVARPVVRDQPRGEKLIEAGERLIARLVKEFGEDGSFPEEFVIRGESIWGRGFTNHALKKAVGLPFFSGTIALYFQQFVCKRVSRDGRLHRQLPGLPKSGAAAMEAAELTPAVPGRWFSQKGSLDPECSVCYAWPAASLRQAAPLKQSDARKALENRASLAYSFALRSRGIKTMRKTTCLLFAVLTAALGASPTNDTAARLQRAAAVLKTLTSSAHGIPSEKLAASDCIAVVPGFKKGAAVVGIGFGKGFISCRTSGGWSAPGSIAVETESLGVQIGGEEIDLVILSLDKDRRAKLLSERFTLGADASAAWGNGKTAHEDPNVKILVYARTKGAFAGFGLDGATLKPDDSGNKSLYGRTVTNHDIVGENPSVPPAASPLIAALPAQ